MTRSWFLLRKRCHIIRLSCSGWKRLACNKMVFQLMIIRIYYNKLWYHGYTILFLCWSWSSAYPNDILQKEVLTIVRVLSASTAQGVMFSCPFHQGRNCKVCQYFILKGNLEYLKDLQIFLLINIIFQFYLVPCSIPSFGGKNLSNESRICS